MDNNLLKEDVVFIDKLISWLRNSMEYSILGKPPEDADILRLTRGELPPYLLIKFGAEEEFISTQALREACEETAQNSLIYEAWLYSSLENAWRYSKFLVDEDKYRFINYFKSYHEIDDVEALAVEADDAIKEARTALYGS